MRKIFIIICLFVSVITISCSSMADYSNNPPSWVENITEYNRSIEGKASLGGPANSFQEAVIEARRNLADLIYFELQNNELQFSYIDSDNFVRNVYSSYAKIQETSSLVTLIGADEVRRWRNPITDEYYVLYEMTMADFEQSKLVTMSSVEKFRHSENTITNSVKNIIDTSNNPISNQIPKLSRPLLSNIFSSENREQDGILNIEIPNLDKDDSFSYNGLFSDEQRVDQFKLKVKGFLPKIYYFSVQPYNTQSDVGLEIINLTFDLYKFVFDNFGKGETEAKSLLLLPGTYSIKVHFINGEAGEYLFFCEH